VNRLHEYSVEIVDVVSVPIALDPSKAMILNVLHSLRRVLTIREIVEVTGLSRKTVERHLESLKYLGLIYEEGRGYTTLRPIKRLSFFKVIHKDFLLVECVTLTASSINNSKYFLRIMVLNEEEIKGKEYRFVPKGAIVLCTYSDKLSSLTSLYSYLLEKLTKATDI